jgi:hypothetical protein
MKVSSGKLLATGMLALGLAASVLSITYRREKTHRALELWGPEHATAVATAPVVTAVWFDPPLEPTDDGEVIERASGQRQNLSGVEGLGTARRLLVEDSSFDWPSDSGARPLGWTYGLEFSDPQAPKVVILLDPATGLVSEAKSRQTGRLRSEVAGQLKGFIEQQFASPQGEPPAE